MPLKRNYARYAPTSGGYVYLYESPSEFLKDRPRTGISSIFYGNGILDLQLLRRSSNNLVVIFHAAADPKSSTLPIFVGQSITHDLDASILYVSDPSLDFGIPIGWFAGDQNRPLQNDLVGITRHIASECGAQNLIFQGASAGGFAALFYSHQFPGSLAIAINPQTDIDAYHPNKVAAYKHACWGGQEPDSKLAVTNLLELYRTSFPNFVLFMQNQRDDFHIENHYRPWEKRFRELYGKQWCTLQGDWGDGHAAPSPYLQELVLKFSLSFDGQWMTLMREDDFKDGLEFPEQGSLT